MDLLQKILSIFLYIVAWGKVESNGGRLEVRVMIETAYFMEYNKKSEH